MTLCSHSIVKKTCRFLVLPPVWSALTWRYWDELNHNVEFLARKTNRRKKRKHRDKKKAPTPQGLRKLK